MKRLTVGGLFSGVGGIELAFRNTGYEVSWSNDMDKYAHITYQSIMGSDHYIGSEAMLIEDMLKLPNKNSISEIDVLVAGFPCQPFSIAGYRKGFDDDRGNVFYRIIDVLIHLRETSKLPSALLLENVKHFRTHDDRKTYKEVKKQLSKLGYSVYTKILNTKDYTDIPQNRERTFMVCFKDERVWNKTALDEITSYSDDFEDIYYNNEIIDKCPKTVAYDKYFRNIRLNNKKQNIHDIIDEDVNDSIYFYKKSSKYYKWLFNEHNVRKDTFYQIRRKYTRENKSNVCPTLTANMGTGGHNVPIFLTKDDRVRKLTPMECFNFQGYDEFEKPEGMANCHLYKQAGNSVTVPLVEILAKNIKKAINL